MGSSKSEAGARPKPEGAGAWRAAAVFGLLAFLQGVVEPTEGLPGQPVRALLDGRGRGPEEIARFVAVVSLPWALKPLLGLMTDFLPMGRSRRRLYVVAAGALAAAVFLSLAERPGLRGPPEVLMAGLFLASGAVALSDVATDAMVVDRGLADGRTGTYQASQWFCLYASGVVTGSAGGALSAGGGVRVALLAASAASALTAVFAAFCVRERPGPVRTELRAAPRGDGWRTGALAVAGFLVVENFNPFVSSALLHLHSTRVLGFSEQFFGDTMSVLAASSMAAAAAYGAFSRRVPLRSLGYASVALGVVSNLAYAGIHGRHSAVVLTALVGLTSMTATLIQFELAALACPHAATGTVFATFMALSNVSASLATWLGGTWYESAGSTLGRAAAFHALVVAAAATTALGWLLVPFLPGERLGPGRPDDPSGNPPPSGP